MKQDISLSRPRHLSFLLLAMACALSPMGAGAQAVLLPPSATAWNVGLRLIDPGAPLDSPPYTVKFRRADTTAWRDALPLRPVASRDGETLFAGSILGLREGTEYEIRIVSPLGEEHVATVRTRQPPKPYEGRIIAVSPGGLAAALEVAEPGDVLTLAAGRYEGPFTITRGGTHEAPITLVAAREADVTLHNTPGKIGAVVSAAGANYVHLRDLTIQGHAPAPAIRGRGARGWVVSSCLVFGGLSLGRSGWWVEDNMVVGRYAEWNIQREKVPGGTGVNAQGFGHVIVHNQVSYFYDGINTAKLFNRDANWPFQVNGPQRGVDIVGNLVFAARDDGIQVDHVGINHRIDGNRVFWAFAGISFQDFFPGPAYATRNVVTDVAWEAWKLMGSTRGVHLYNNSSVSAFANVSTRPEVRDVRALNNMFAGKRGIRLGPPEPRSAWNHNGYVLPDEFPAVEWSANDADTHVDFPTLADWTRATGLERDGVVLIPGEDLAGPIETTPANPPLDAANLVPTPSSRLRGRGQVIPTVSGDTNAAPPIGAYAAGESVPHYGPRRVIPGALARGFYVDVERLQLTTEPVGYSPLTMKEQIVRFIDVYNVSLPVIAGIGFALGLLLGVFIGWRWARRRVR